MSLPRSENADRSAISRRRKLIEHLRKSLLTAAVVGSILCLINHSYRAHNLASIALNYAVPFLVSMYAKLTARATA